MQWIHARHSIQVLVTSTALLVDAKVHWHLTVPLTIEIYRITSSAHSGTNFKKSKWILGVDYLLQ